MAVQIVQIADDHIESFYRALDFVARERRYLAFLAAPPIESVRAFVLDNIAKGHPQLVALSAGEVVGWCDILSKSQPVHAHVGVLGIALLPDFRGSGLGRRLMRQTLDAARAFGLHRVELTVREDNTSAIALYRKLGFEIEGVLRDGIKIDGACQNVVLMGLLFD